MSTSRPALLWVLAYSVCSTAMLLANKAALNTYPLPLALTCVQLIFAATVTLPLVLRGGFTRTSAKSLSLYVFEGILFAASISLNLKALSMTNVGMMVIARSCLPIVVYLLELLLGSAGGLSFRSTVSLVCVVAFSSLYALDAQGVKMNHIGLVYVAAWLLILACQMIYGKWLIAAVQLRHWERVFYTNGCGLPVLTILAHHETKLLFAEFSSDTVSNTILLLTCVAGVAIGYTSWRVRSLVSATTFSLVGVLNKMGTICLAFLLWPSEGSYLSFVALVGCLGSGMLYEGNKPAATTTATTTTTTTEVKARK